MKREQRLVDLKIEQSGKPTSEKMNSHGSVSDLPADIVSVDRVLIRLLTSMRIGALSPVLSLLVCTQSIKVDTGLFLTLDLLFC